MADNRYNFLMSLHVAKHSYEGDSRTKGHGDFSQYLADSFYIAMSMLADELAASNPELKHLPKVVSGAKYAIKGVAVTVQHVFSCPVKSDHSHVSLLNELDKNIKAQAGRDIDTVKNLLNQLKIRV